MRLEGFITKRTKDSILIQTGGYVDGMFLDGFAEVKPGEIFYNWTFDELQNTDQTMIVLSEGQNGTV